MPKVPKIRSLHIFAISPEKHGENVVDFVPAEKHKALLGDSITLGVCSQACPKYPKQRVSNISRKIRKMKLIFCLQINVKSFFKLTL